MSKPVLFGSFGGEDVHEVTLRTDSGAEAKVITYGAVIRDLKVPSPEGLRRVLLGFDTLDAYVGNKHWHLGAVPGPVANRIAGGSFTLDGDVYSLPHNQAGRHTLHSGDNGFGARNWTLVAYDRRSVTLALIADDGDDGFPGRLTTTVTYRLIEPATLQISYCATTDKATPVNLTNHAYFNLDGGGDVLAHRLVLEADFFTPTDGDLIPTGEILAVKGTPWDFRTERPIRFETSNGLFHYDGNVILRGSGALAPAARVVSAQGDVTMEVWTTKPGLQFFDAATLKVSSPGLDGMRLLPRSGFCLEPQFFPDSINKPHFQNCVLRPDEVYTHRTEYRFGR
ncbi:MAG: galactose mutarotase [Ancalomicrobiaceae bacterium]|nr:galactose mutarotase [Ancalomicrobiaceae bacterium]